MYQEAINKIKPKLEEVLGQLSEKFKAVRTGKANPSLIENLMVTYYGTQTPLKQMATLSTPNANLILVTPWDKNSLGDIELAIRNSNIGLSPVNDGAGIKVILPQLTEERRQELAKHIKTLSEEAKVVARNLRAEAWQEIKDMEKNSQITEDDRYRAEEELNKLVNDNNKKVDEMLAEKDKEIMTI